MTPLVGRRRRSCRRSRRSSHAGPCAVDARLGCAHLAEDARMPPSIAAADPLDFSETVAMPHAHARAGGRALRCVAAARWAVAFAGQLLFAFYIVMFYAGNAL